MCVWQSHAPAGMAKLTGVAGCEGSANVDPARDKAPAAIAPNTTSRLVVMMILLVGLRPLPLAPIAGRRNRGHGCSRLRQPFESHLILVRATASTRLPSPEPTASLWCPLLALERSSIRLTGRQLPGTASAARSRPRL